MQNFKNIITVIVAITFLFCNQASARFLSVDPVGPVDPSTSRTDYSYLQNPQKLNRYAYGLNNPYRYIDPDGRAVVENETDTPVVVSGNVGKGHGSGEQSFGVIPAKKTGGGDDNPVVGYKTRAEAIYAAAPKNYGPHQPQGNIHDIDYYDDPANKTHPEDRADNKIIGDDKGPTFDLKKSNDGRITPDAHNHTIPGAYIRRGIEKLKGI